jgi:Amt family ammonium transporter
MMKRFRMNPLLLFIAALCGGSSLMAMAGEVSFEAEGAGLRLNTLWLLMSTFLIFIMHLGFATLEAGLTRAKNTVNILFKNTSVLVLGLLGFALCGYSLMFHSFPEGGDFRFFGFAGWGLGEMDGGISTDSESAYAVTEWSFFLFQGMFAATCATIVSGAVAERIKLSAFLLFSAVYVSLVYPVLGSWTWGKGWLYERGFTDFAGATLVHSVGGWAALAGALVLGPRLGKFVNSTVKPIIGHNLPLATIGVFLLWFGWYGFNGGSVFSHDIDLLSRVVVMTSLSAAAGVLSAMMISWMSQRKPDLTVTLNGALGGLVGVTAGADVFSVNQALGVGAVSGLLVVCFVNFFDRVRIDDPVGALSAHLICGIWGTLAVGVFSAAHSFWTQLFGVVVYGLSAFGAALILFLALKHTLGIRVSEEEELSGLDLGEHGMEAYTGFQIFTTQ